MVVFGTIVVLFTICSSLVFLYVKKKNELMELEAELNHRIRTAEDVLEKKKEELDYIFIVVVGSILLKYGNL